jgi:hypothetical protein
LGVSECTQAPGGEPGRYYPEYAQRPEAFVREVLGAGLWSLQAEVLTAVATDRQVTVRSCHGIGKSFLAACGVLWWLYCHRPALVLTTAPTARQVEAVLWREIALRFRQCRGRLEGRLLTTRLEVGEEQLAIGLSTNEPERFAGLHSAWRSGYRLPPAPRG